jgi:hypothetical protein
MIDTLLQAEKELPTLLQNEDIWRGLYADSERPHLMRLWCQWGENRINLHHFSHCRRGERFWHGHPWKMAVRVLEGEYEMGVGYQDEFGVIKNIDLLMGSGSLYDMCDQYGRHYVRPVGDGAWTLMVTGPVVWSKQHLAVNTPSRDLTALERTEIFSYFRAKYPLPS